MAWDDDYDLPEHWSTPEKDMYDNLTGGDHALQDDQTLQALFDVALFQPGITPHERSNVIRAMEDYLRDEYDLVFDDIFDWDAYREWYESRAS